MLTVNHPKHNKINRYEYANVIGYPIHYKTAMVEYFNTLQSTGAVSIMWLTDWENLAVENLAPALGLGEFPYLPNEEGTYRPFDNDWWKIHALHKFLGNLPNGGMDQPWVWVDDNIWKHHKVNMSVYSNSKLLKTEPSSGFLDIDKVRLEKFLDKFTE